MTVLPGDLARTLMSRAAASLARDERERSECLVRVGDALRKLRVELALARVWIIGSLVWGSFGVRSDVDVVVEAAFADLALLLAFRHFFRHADAIVFEAGHLTTELDRLARASAAVDAAIDRFVAFMQAAMSELG